MTATDQLAEFVASTRLADIPADVIARGRLVLADCVGCMVAGAVVPEMRRLAALHVDRANPVATVLGTGQRLTPDAASFINGTAGTWHDLDEGNRYTQRYAVLTDDALLVQRDGQTASIQIKEIGEAKIVEELEIFVGEVFKQFAEFVVFDAILFAVLAFRGFKDFIFNENGTVDS